MLMRRICSAVGTILVVSTFAVTDAVGQPCPYCDWGSQCKLWDFAGRFQMAVSSQARVDMLSSNPN